MSKTDKTPAIVVTGGNGNRQTTMTIGRRVWRNASDGASVPFGRPGCAPVVTADPTDPDRVAVRMSAAATRMVAAGIVTAAATIAAAAVRAASPDGMGGHIGRVYDGDVIAVLDPDADRAAFRRDHGMGRPAVGR